MLSVSCDGMQGSGCGHKATGSSGSVAVCVESGGMSITGCMVAVRGGAHYSHNGMCSTNVGRSDSVQFAVHISLQNGLTAMDKARDEGHMDIVELLKHYSHTH